ncbi:peptidyl-prolyl cis-trans isomerase cyclophilin type [Gloeothece citriformis PCC 7424]|uniref:peptidylprolyl isomerase n=1 Tax=Gloeothece citriformis (strain PCC 7424) TaxID=65393 RepID=B7KGU9_GLOC7|nr:peptidyl-prolyl cis-trans isomerase cyclophilin type [Gloeothece citriformis PCC 7424]
MKPVKHFWLNGFKGLLKTSLVTLLFFTLSMGICQPGWTSPIGQPMLMGILAQGDAVTDPRAILRNALPIDNSSIRTVQADLEGLPKYLKVKRWGSLKKDLKNAAFILTLRRDSILESVPDELKPQAETLIDELKSGVEDLQEVANTQDKQEFLDKQKKLLPKITQIEELMVQGFPFEVPEEYANLPQLKGRATVEMTTTKGDLTIIVDGYSAPINGGNFVDLVQKGFYDGLPFLRSEDDFVIQSGDPPGKEQGFIDPQTGQYRAIPLEVLLKDQDQPIYGLTLEEAGIYLPDLALPFSAYGAVALARPELDPNGGSSQFFFFKFDNELTPPGFNLMDGRYSVFGYLVDGQDVLKKLTDKDKIISAKVVDGLDNLVEPEAG